MIEWCRRPEFTHALTLAPNRRNITPDMLAKMFGAFCREVDRLMFGTKHAHRRPTWERFQAIAFPEMLEGNPHLHCVANFSRLHWQSRLDRTWQQELPVIWHRLTRKAGDLDLQEKWGAGWERYITKEAYRPRHDFLLAADFHNIDRVEDKALKAIVATLK
ncbi:MAG TPA: hypothetical protein VNH53_00835 [Sphingomicrobium sp.]|nr:hypothetical protein [Sphingomicrobium sp.]